MLAVLGPLGAPELVIILVIVVLIFGVGKMADVGGALGSSIREFRKAAKGPDELPSESKVESAPAEAAQATATAPSCSKCNAQLDAQAKFCAECGTPAQAAVN